MKKYYFYTIFAIMNIVFASLLIRLSNIGPIASGAYRLLLAVPFLVAIACSTQNNPIKISKTTLMWSCIAGAFFAADLSVYNLSIIYTTLAEANLLTNIVPFIITPIAVIFLKEKVPTKFYIAMLIALMGILLLMHEAMHNSLHESGNLFAILSACFYAVFLTAIKKASNGKESVNVFMIPVCICGGICLLGIAYAHNEIIFPTSYHAWLIVISVAISGQILGQTTLAYSIKYIPLQLASLFLLLSPIFAAIYAMIFFNEYLSFLQWLGIAIILIAIYSGKVILQQNSKSA